MRINKKITENILRIDRNFCSVHLNLKIDVGLKVLRAVVIRRFSLNEAPLGLSKFISDYLPYFEKISLSPHPVAIVFSIAGM
jgi:hypothetical protein